MPSFENAISPFSRWICGCSINFSLSIETNFSKSITLKKILKKYKGENETLLAIKQENKKSIVKLDKEYYVNPTEQFILEVEELLGKNTIAIR